MSVTIDGQVIALNGETNLLHVIRKANIQLPTFCYHSELSVYGACRMCVVEKDGEIVAACTTPPQPGMKIRTNSPRLQEIRRLNLELMLADHHRDCITCSKNGTCRLQDLAQQFDLEEIRFGHRDETLPIDRSTPALIRNPNKCILCGDCVRTCREIQGLGILDFAHRGSRVVVSPAFNRELAEVDCVQCGQCVLVCPTAALTIKEQKRQVWQALADPKVQVVAQVAPAVRVSLSEMFNLEPGVNTMGKLVGALKRLGFDAVFDTCYAADLTAVEETREFMGRLEKGGPLPHLTSCCPAWVKYLEHNYPEFLKNLSTCRSPQQMFASLIKGYLNGSIQEEGTSLYVVSIMPCTAKKFEASREEFAGDVDAVLTTTEIGEMIKQAGIMFQKQESKAVDRPLGFSTGGGMIFGVTGGVSEAVLRTAHQLITKEEMAFKEFKEVRGLQGIKTKTVQVGPHEIRLGVVSGLANAQSVLKRIQTGELELDILEVMACPGGCIGGGGQPAALESREQKISRSKGLYDSDHSRQIHSPLDNPLIQKLYTETFQESGERHDLHTTYHSRRRIAGSSISVAQGEKVNVSVCVGTSCHLKGSYDLLQEIMRRIDGEQLQNVIDLKATFCFESCDRGPSVTIEGEVLSPATIDQVMDQIHGQLG